MSRIYFIEIHGKTGIDLLIIIQAISLKNMSVLRNHLYTLFPIFYGVQKCASVCQKIQAGGTPFYGV
jgi:hypothetical protein